MRVYALFVFVVLTVLCHAWAVSDRGRNHRALKRIEAATAWAARPENFGERP